MFNLGNGVGFSVKEVIDVARSVTGHPIPAEVRPRRAGDPEMCIRDRFGPVPGLLADRTGSYVPAYLLFAALLTLAIVLVRMAYVRANRQKV